ncbi:MAG: dTMP kinase [Candidatus Aminicenantales bacterium]
MLKKGILIVLEGIDGAGKSTQARFLLRKLQAMGMDVVYFREPSRGKWGREIKAKAIDPRSLAPEEELSLFQKDRKENVEKNIRPALECRKIVILDRYYFSTIAYQGSKGIDPARIKRMNERFAPKPDLVFILDIGARQGLSRIQDRKKKERLFEREDYLVKVRKIFNGLKGRKFIHLNGLEEKKQISRKIAERVIQYLQNWIV